jgi:hypothetical protein
LAKKYAGTIDQLLGIKPGITRDGLGDEEWASCRSVMCN